MECLGISHERYVLILKIGTMMCFKSGSLPMNIDQWSNICCGSRVKRNGISEACLVHCTGLRCEVWQVLHHICDSKVDCHQTKGKKESVLCLCPVLSLVSVTSVWRDFDTHSLWPSCRLMCILIPSALPIGAELSLEKRFQVKHRDCYQCIGCSFVDGCS